MSLFATESVDGKSACTRDTCASNTYARGICAGNAFSTIGIYIKSAGSESTSTENANTENIYIRNAGTIEYSRIPL